MGSLATNRPARWLASALAICLAAGPAAWAQREPHVGYAYPPGATQGATVEITVGGQYLNGAKEVYFSGTGVRARIIGYDKPLSRKQLNDLSKKVRELTKRLQTKAAKKSARRRIPLTSIPDAANTFKAASLAIGLDLDLATFLKLRKKLTDPKRQPNAQIDEKVTLYLTVADKAAPGLRELRIRTGRGVSNPILFRVGQFREHREAEPNDRIPDANVPDWLPATINGQILPGDVDRFSFRARKGMRLVAAVGARSLVPYLADAVPGWFQATLRLLDEQGNELAYRDDFRFHPDPVLYYEVPADGRYVLEIKDAIYRGREDFVYQIDLGELPFVTGVFPLGGRSGAKHTVKLSGWNLPVRTLTLDANDPTRRDLPVRVARGRAVSNHVPFALGDLPECLEKEPNNDRAAAQKLTGPIVVNGRIDRPGDRDVFRFTGRKGEKLVAEIHARRLGSPLDSLLTLADEKGKPLASNDDHADPAAGLTTHQADSRLMVTLPADGTYVLTLSDTQRQGSPAHAYRLRLDTPRPDFALRVVPSTISARTAQTVPICVHALRKDGFQGPIDLSLVGAPRGFRLAGGWIPPGRDKARMTLTVPGTAPKAPVKLRLEGLARLGDRQVRRPARPAEDMMQAFLYRHLVPMTDWLVAVTGSKRSAAPFRLLEDGPVRLPVGGGATVRVVTNRWLAQQKLQVQISEPPDGVTIAKVAPGDRGVTVHLQADAKAKAGWKGNLILTAFYEKPGKNKEGKLTGRMWRSSLGALPAVPIEIAPAAQAATRPAGELARQDD